MLLEQCPLSFRYNYANLNCMIERFISVSRFSTSMMDVDWVYDMDLDKYHKTFVEPEEPKHGFCLIEDVVKPI